MREGERGEGGRERERDVCFHVDVGSSKMSCLWHPGCNNNFHASFKFVFRKDLYLALHCL